MEFTIRILEQAVEFIDSLPIKMQSKVLRTIDLLREFGYTLTAPYSKSLKGTEGLKELRVKSATDICRLFYFHFRDRIYVVTSGYVKKKNESDRREIERAVRLMREVMRKDSV